MERIVLSEATEFQLKDGTVLKVYPLSGEKIIEIFPQVEELEKLQASKDIRKVITLCMTLVYEIVKEDNPTITTALLLKNLPISGGVKIINIAMGVAGV